MSISHVLRKAIAAVAAGIAALTLFVGAVPLVHAATYFIPNTLPDAFTGARYEQSIRSNHSYPYVWSVRSGALPPGLTGVVSADQRVYKIEGVPTTPGTYTFELSTTRGDVPGSTSDSPQQTFALVVKPFIITTETLPNAQVGASYAQTLAVSGGTAPYEWSVTGGQLPVGLTLNVGTGVISGTPSFSLDYLFTVKAKDTNGLTTYKSLTIHVDPVAVPVIATASALPTGRVGVSYGVDLVGTGGSSPYRWSVAVGSALPPGLTLNSTATDGQLRGTPTASGSYTFTIKLNDAADRSSTKTFSVAIEPATPSTPVLNITTSSLASGRVGSYYSAFLTATGGVGAYSWNFASGSLPPGLMLSSNGTISGTPVAAGTYTANIEVFDATRAFVGRSFSITIQPAMTDPGSSELMNRLNNLARMGISVHALVKLPDDGNRFTQADSAVYYIGADGRRHAFPNDRVYFTWYTNFGGVRIVSSGDLASIPLGANATYRPGVKMVKFQTDPKVYAVSGGRTLRWVRTEAVAIGLYGSAWNRQIDDIADTFYLDYNFGGEIMSAGEFSPVGAQSAARYVSDVLPL